MINLRESKYDEEIFKDLKIDCKKCFGFCCVALYFSASEGFPMDKEAGETCINLNSDFSCAVHNNLRKNGLKGCTAYDCFGAGQKVAQVTYGGYDWKQTPELKNQMFDVFLVMRQLNEMLWYLTDALTFIQLSTTKDELNLMIKETKELTNLDAKSIMEIDIEKHRVKVNSILRQVNELVEKRVTSDKKVNLKNKKSLISGYDFIGANLTKTNLIGEDLAGALLIATNLSNTNLAGTNLIGADLRDADIRGANLADSMFITQSQVNTAKGDSNTKLPRALVRPFYWDK
ncbi:pentapeptide repeat-containing protein [Romboutsia maritimum]|uniref:Pentapeptide repeat-containing protein n=1 Tax=Romboutsia maritimum TaxID=2020948 RepID=A0A371ISM6_9FIRM|nr:pentapeptide repeat-containing protein [Romboutsia maritimum]RDY23469.1 pentapeptide repeat-containing protein [Romboutsia maritimum]